MFSIRKSIAVGVFIACFSGLVLAQGGATGAISGTVQDASGAVVTGAKVDIVSEATGQVVRHMTTDSSGVFTANLLPVGSYRVEVSASGFATTKFPGVVVNITETTRLTASLKVTSVNEVIQVESQVAQVDTTDATTGQSLSRQRSGASPGTFINTSIPVIPANRSAANLESVFSSPATANCPAVNLTSIDPVALALLNFQSNQFGSNFLLPTVAGTPGVTQTYNPTTKTCSSALNYGPLILSTTGKFRDDQFTTNWDREFRGGKDRLAFRFFWADSDTFQPFGADSFQIQTGGAPTPNNQIGRAHV